jgi:WD40 repeat protein
MSEVDQKSSWDAFISYSRRDKDFVRCLIEHLQTYNQAPWIDWDDIPPLSEWRQEIRQGILSSSNFLFVLSPDSLASNECAKELECAVDSHKRLVPIVCRSIEGCAVPQALSSINWIFFNDPNNFEQSFQCLIQALNTDLDYIKAHTRLLTRADEWDSQKQDDSFLLRGRNLESVETWLANKSHHKPSLTRLQRDYIANSRIAETQRQKKETRNQRIALGSVASALVIVTMLGLITETRRRDAVAHEITALNSASIASLALGNPLEAMVQALRANIRLQKATWIEEPLRVETLSALGQTAYTIQERNRLEAHERGVESVEFSPNGQLIASGSRDGTLRLWTREGDLTATWPVSDGGRIIDISFSPDGQLLASGGEDTSIQLWNLEGELINTLERHDDNYGVEFSPDGQTIASASLDGKMRLWRVEGMAMVQSIEHPDMVLSVSFNPADASLVSSSMDGTLNILKPDGTTTTIKDEEREVLDVSFSPDGSVIASAGRNGILNLWQPDGTFLQKLTGGTRDFWATDFSADGQLIAATGVEQVIYIWRQDGTLVTTLPGHQATVRHLSFSPNEALLASASDDLSVRLWQWNNPWKNQLFGHTDSVNSVALNAKTQTLVSAGQDGTLKVWSATGELIKDLPTSLPWINAVAISPDGQWMVAGATNSKDSEQGQLHLWAADGEYQSLLGEQGQWISAVAFSPNSQLVAAASNDGLVQIRTLSGELQRSLDHTTLVYAIAFSPDGRMLAAAGVGSVNIWDVETGALTHTYTRSASIRSLSFSPDGKTLALGSSDRTVSLWPLQEPAPYPLEKKHGGEVYAVQFSPDGRQLASAGQDKTIRLWTAAGKEIATIGSHGATIKTLQFTADGSKVITGSEDKTLMIWDLNILDPDRLVSWSCDWLADYLRTNPNVSPEDRQLCQGGDPWMP